MEHAGEHETSSMCKRFRAHSWERKMGLEGPHKNGGPSLTFGRLRNRSP